MPTSLWVEGKIYRAIRDEIDTIPLLRHMTSGIRRVVRYPPGKTVAEDILRHMVRVQSYHSIDAL
jgi:hypothetical protein